MKKKATFLLVVSSIGLLLTGCSAKGAAQKGKDLLKKSIKKVFGYFDKFFASDNPSKTASGVEYTLSYHK